MNIEHATKAFRLQIKRYVGKNQAKVRKFLEQVDLMDEPNQ